MSKERTEGERGAAACAMRTALARPSGPPSAAAPTTCDARLLLGTGVTAAAPRRDPRTPAGGEIVFGKGCINHT